MYDYDIQVKITIPNKKSPSGTSTFHETFKSWQKFVDFKSAWVNQQTDFIIEAEIRYTA